MQRRPANTWSPWQSAAVLMRKAFKNMVAFGPEFPGQGSAIHQPNEFVEIDKMMKSCQIVAAAMYELAQKD